jgi:OOP family OmpA-OmpF porin
MWQFRVKDSCEIHEKKIQIDYSSRRHVHMAHVFNRRVFVMKQLSMKKILTIFSAISLFSVTAMAEPEKEGGGFYLMPTLSYSVFDNDLSLEDDFSYGLGAGYKFTSHWATELTYNYVDTENEDTHEDVGVDYWQWDGIYYFNPVAKYKPFLGLGIGEVNYDYERPVNPKSDYDTAEVSAIVGVAYTVSPEIELRAFARGLAYEEPKNEKAFGVDFDIAFVYFFGELTRPAKVQPAPVAVAPKEELAPVVAVVDKDSDSDGVLDGLDKCADTSKGAKVTADGCYVELIEDKEFTLHLKFDTNKAVIKPAAVPQVANLAEFLKEYAHTKAVIEGHTDDVGSSDANRALSQRRAEAVKASLINDYGIAADRITAIGYGEDKPVATNDTAEGQAENRRVMAKISSKK